MIPIGKLKFEKWEFLSEEHIPIHLQDELDVKV
jgi:hypothetical protein